MKIISYSIFGKEQLYRVGLLKNIEIAKKLFPEWKVFIHLNTDHEQKDFLKSINQPHTKIVDLKEDHPQDGFLWRMLPLEQNYEAVIVRDVDTRLFNRDKELVDCWMKSNCKYHVSRDNYGSFQPILGGLWGGKNSNLKISEHWNNWKKNQGDKLWDIGFLKKYVYPEIRKDLLVFTEHTIYLGEKNITKLGPREKYKGRSISLGMVVEEDIQSGDDEIDDNRNQERIDNYIYYDSSKDKNNSLIKILFPRFYFKNPFFNFLYILFTFLYFLIDYKNFRTISYIKQKIISLIFRKNSSKADQDKVILWH